MLLVYTAHSVRGWIWGGEVKDKLEILYSKVRTLQIF